MKKSGWIVLDKPEGISSNKAMSIVRRTLKEKTGYVGTLDPFAQGILPIAVGEARKFIHYVNDSQKEYEFTIKFGEETDTLDKYGSITQTSSRIPALADITDLLPSFIGDLEQIPPCYSAIKINGIRAYKMARNNEKFEIKPKKVTVFSLDIISADLLSDGYITLKCICGKGTYIRSLARDICHRLNTIGHLIYLRRNWVSFLKNTPIITLDNIDEIDYNTMLPEESALDDIPAFCLGDESVLKLQQGVSQDCQLEYGEMFKIHRISDGKFCGLAKLVAPHVLKPLRMCSL